MRCMSSHATHELYMLCTALYSTHNSNPELFKAETLEKVEDLVINQKTRQLWVISPMCDSVGAIYLRILAAEDIYKGYSL